jgi:hypothetical protein
MDDAIEGRPRAMDEWGRDGGGGGRMLFNSLRRAFSARKSRICFGVPLELGASCFFVVQLNFYELRGLVAAAVAAEMENIPCWWHLQGLASPC